MDVFTCCRIMKTEGKWYTNIIIYAGDSHRQICVKLLEKYGCEHEDIYEDHSKCIDEELVGGKRSRRKRPKKKSKKMKLGY